MVNPSPRPPVRLSRRMAFAMLVAGSLAAWGLVVGIVWAATRSGDPDSPPPTAPIAGRPSLVFLTGTPRPTATVTPTIMPTSTPSPTHTLTPVPTDAPAATLPLSPTAAPVASVPTVIASLPPCAPPDGWQRYEVQPDDTLFAFQLGADNRVTVDQIVAANCLTSRYLQIGQVLYLPPGAAENAPSSYPAAAPQPSGPRVAACPCTITIQVGWRREQIADAINAAQTAFSGADFLAATAPGASAPYDFVGGGHSMEGFLFPGTYTVMNETTAEQFRDMLLGAFDANIPAHMRADAAAQGISFYEVMIVASIVQRESRDPETQKLVASVYYNRLRSGNRLGSTVTLQYALGGPGNWWPRVGGGSLNMDSPYNTLNRPGLPPSPIDSPGLSAIIAAIYPAQTNYFYHTASCNGTGEVFAATYEEHLANVNCE